MRALRWLIVIALVLVSGSLAQAQTACMQLNWNAATGGVLPVDHYNVYRDGVKVGQSTTTSFLDSGLTASTSYSYRVATVDSAGNEGAPSAAVSNTTLAASSCASARTFVPVHTYFMAPSGNDSNSGLDAAHPWASPNHNAGNPSGFPGFVCGDVIVAAPGAYTNAIGQMGVVSNCPSTSRGIDGTGQIWAAVLLCNGDLAPTGAATSCNIDCHNAGACAYAPGGNCSPGCGNGINAALGPDHSFWAIEGWVLQGDGISDNGGSGTIEFMPTSCGKNSGYGPSTGVTHHVSLINSIIYNVGQGWAPNDCNQDHESTAGADYLAVVGLITQNSNFTNRFGVCIAAVDLVAPGVFGTATDTHVWWSDIINYNQISPDCNGAFDGENFMFDTIDDHTPVSNSTYVIRNTIGYYATRMCMSWQFHTQSFTAPFMKFYNNTCYKNAQTDTTGGTLEEGLQTDCFFDGSVCVLPWQIQIYNNIVFEPDVHPPLGSSSIDIYAWQTGGNSTNVTNGTAVRAGAQNIFWDVTPRQQYNFSPTSGVAPIVAIGTNGTIGLQATDSGPLDLYQNPNFKNPTDLINNHLGVPNCSGFINTTQCAGWNAVTQTMTVQSIIDDLKPNCSGLANVGNTQWCGGKGYQPPTTTCVSSGDIATDFPPWLKGLVYLHWTGSAVEQRFDLATLPCGR
jgi:hypothetical protein